MSTVQPGSQHRPSTWRGFLAAAPRPLPASPALPRWAPLAALKCRRLGPRAPPTHTHTLPPPLLCPQAPAVTPASRAGPARVGAPAPLPEAARTGDSPAARSGRVCFSAIESRLRTPRASGRAGVRPEALGARA